MCINPTMITGLLLVTGVCININTMFATAFTPSTAIHDAHITPTSQSYTKGVDTPSPFPKLAWDTPPPPRQEQQQKSQTMIDDHDPFEVWAKTRLGLGTGPGSNSNSVFWVGEGALYEAYTGRILAIFEGFDVGRGVQLDDNHIRQISRKIFWFRDPATGEIMTEYEGEAVQPIVYGGQMIDYRKSEEDGSITYSVEASKRSLKDALPEMKVTSRMAGPHQMMINIPVFVDIPIAEERGGGRYRAWEFYDFGVDPSFPLDRPPTVSWSRQGSVPPFTDKMNSQEAVLKFSGYRVESYEELPDRMRMEVERAYPLFIGAPRDEKEVQEIFGKR